jgi:hypothetical protein
MIANAYITVATVTYGAHVTEVQTQLYRVVCNFAVAVPEVIKILIISRTFTIQDHICILN